MRDHCSSFLGLSYPEVFPYIDCEPKVGDISSGDEFYTEYGYIGTHSQMTGETHNRSALPVNMRWWTVSGEDCSCWTSASSGTNGGWSRDRAPWYAWSNTNCADKTVGVMCASREKNIPNPTAYPTKSPTLSPTLDPIRLYGYVVDWFPGEVMANEGLEKFREKCELLFDSEYPNVFPVVGCEPMIEHINEMGGYVDDRQGNYLGTLQSFREHSPAPYFNWWGMDEEENCECWTSLSGNGMTGSRDNPLSKSTMNCNSIGISLMCIQKMGSGTPTIYPTKSPTKSPTTSSPTKSPTSSPTKNPTNAPTVLSGNLHLVSGGPISSGGGISSMQSRCETVTGLTYPAVIPIISCEPILAFITHDSTVTTDLGYVGTWNDFKTLTALQFLNALAPDGWWAPGGGGCSCWTTTGSGGAWADYIRPWFRDNTHCAISHLSVLCAISTPEIFIAPTKSPTTPTTRSPTKSPTTPTTRSPTKTPTNTPTLPPSPIYLVSGGPIGSGGGISSMQARCSSVTGLTYPQVFPMIACEPALSVLNDNSYLLVDDVPGMTDVWNGGTWGQLKAQSAQSKLPSMLGPDGWWAPSTIGGTCNCWTLTGWVGGVWSSAGWGNGQNPWFAGYADCDSTHLTVLCAISTAEILPTKTPTLPPTVISLVSGGPIGSGGGISSMQARCSSVTGLTYPQVFPIIACEPALSVLNDDSSITTHSGYVGTWGQFKAQSGHSPAALSETEPNGWWAPGAGGCSCWTLTAGNGGAFADSQYPWNRGITYCSESYISVLCGVSTEVIILPPTVPPTFTPTTKSPTKTPSKSPTKTPSKSPTVTITDLYLVSGGAITSGGGISSMRSRCNTATGLTYPAVIPVISCEPLLTNIIDASTITTHSGYVGTWAQFKAQSGYNPDALSETAPNGWWSPGGDGCSCWTLSTGSGGSWADYQYPWFSDITHCAISHLSVLCAVPYHNTPLPNIRLISGGATTSGGGITSMRSKCEAASGLTYPNVFPIISCEPKMSEIHSFSRMVTDLGYVGTWAQFKAQSGHDPTALSETAPDGWWAPGGGGCSCWTTTGSGGAWANNQYPWIRDITHCAITHLSVLCGIPFITTSTPTQSPTPFPTRSPTTFYSVEISLHSGPLGSSAYYPTMKTYCESVTGSPYPISFPFVSTEREFEKLKKDEVTIVNLGEIRVKDFLENRYDKSLVASILPNEYLFGHGFTDCGGWGITSRWRYVTSVNPGESMLDVYRYLECGEVDRRVICARYETPWYSPSHSHKVYLYPLFRNGGVGNCILVKPSIIPDGEIVLFRHGIELPPNSIFYSAHGEYLTDNLKDLLRMNIRDFLGPNCYFWGSDCPCSETNDLTVGGCSFIGQGYVNCTSPNYYSICASIIATP